MSDERSHVEVEWEIQNLNREVRDLRKQVKKLQDDKSWLIGVIVIGVLVALLSPKFTILSDDTYKMRMETLQRETVDKEWADFWASDSATNSAMICIAFDRYFNDTASPALVRWIETDYDFSSLEKKCFPEPDPEPIIPEE